MNIIFYIAYFYASVLIISSMVKSSVGIVMGYGLDGQGLIPSRDRFFSAPQHPERLWVPPSLLPNRYQWLIPLGVSGPGMKLIAYLHLVTRSIMVELYLHSPIHLHSVVLN
jgi:hypothetical protein